jgi:pimeloyl-ACP methyl ester carboxylesterase
MNNYTHQTAPTQFREAGEIRFAYRRWGKKGGVPMLFFMHFTGTMDHWDPALTDAFAQDREVILFDNSGISNSSGEVPPPMEEMAQHAAPFIDALGFSMGGGFVARQFTIDRFDPVTMLFFLNGART